MKNIKWDLLKVLQVVAKLESISAAGNHLNIDQSSISRSIKQLEVSLGITLFKRTPAGVKITNQGKVLLDTVNDFSYNLNIAFKKMDQENSNEASGEITISAPLDFGYFILTDLIKKFIKKYPKINIKFLLNNNETINSFNDADIYFANHIPNQNKAFFRFFYESQNYVFASKEYIKKHGDLNFITDFKNHSIISVIDNEAKKNKNPVLLYTIKKRTIVNSNQIAYKLACNHIGITVLPDYIVSKEDNLVKVLNNIKLKGQNYYMVIPHEITNIDSIQLFKDFALNEIRKKLK